MASRLQATGKPFFNGEPLIARPFYNIIITRQDLTVKEDFKMAKIEIKKNEFRKNNSKKTAGHPTYIYAQIGNEFKFIGITHSDITDSVKNIELQKNPEPKNKSKAYVRPNPEKAHKASFGTKLKGWCFSQEDKKTIEVIKKKPIGSIKKQKK